MDLILLTVNSALGALAATLALSREIIRTRRHTPPTQPPPACACTARTHARPTATGESPAL